MKKTLFFLSLLSGLFFISSCNEDIELSGDFVETAVIYGILDQSDSVHLIKITRAFIGPGNSLSIAQIPDSSYFDQVDATITEIIGGNEARVWTLQDTIVYDKEDGVWYAPEQKLYYFTTSSGEPLLSTYSGQNVQYRLDVTLNGGEFAVSGLTTIVDGISSTVGNNNVVFKFAQNLAEYKNGSITVNVGNSAAVHAEVEVSYKEFIATSETMRSFSWQLGEQEVAANETSKIFSLPGLNFYNFMAADIEKDNNPLVDKRNFEGLEFTLVGAGEELYNYMLVSEPSSSLSQNKPTYTNMTATNGRNVIGIFSSRQTVKIYKPFVYPPSQFVRAIDKNSTYELCSGPITGTYFFCSQHSVDIAQGYTWACD